MIAIFVARGLFAAFAFFQACENHIRLAVIALSVSAMLDYIFTAYENRN